MIQIENTEVFGWDAAIRGMRNPLNSWGQSDSLGEEVYWEDGIYYYTNEYRVGGKDLDLMKRLVKAGSDHSKFMRMIHVQCDVVAPIYWWKEYDTYKVGTVANSCSTMHKIHAKEFTLDDFSHEHLIDYDRKNPSDCYIWNEEGVGHNYPFDILGTIIEMLNAARKRYIETKDKKYWWQMIQLLPSSYNQRRTLDLNYAVLRNIYHSRKNHKLDEWHTFCEWVEGLPYSELITM